jgi:phage shock protein A
MSDSLNQLVEQAAGRLHMRLTPRDVLVPELKQFAESATQALREQSEVREALVRNQADEIARLLRQRDGEAALRDKAEDERNVLSVEAQSLREQIAQMTQERNDLREQWDAIPRSNRTTSESLKETS